MEFVKLGKKANNKNQYKYNWNICNKNKTKMT